MTTNDIWARLAIEFPSDLERQYQGRGQRTFTYIEPRDVMERLDEVLTPAGWQFEARAVNDAVAHGRLSIKVGDEWIAREDFGYPNNSGDAAETLKEAQSDALRRCAMAFGVARYLYRRDNPGHAAPRPTERPRTAAAPRAQATTPEEPDYLLEEARRMFSEDVEHDTLDAGGPMLDQRSAQRLLGVVDESKCPDHNKPWKHGSKGYYCNTPVEKNGDVVVKWCPRRPSKAWQAAQELVPA